MSDEESAACDGVRRGETAALGEYLRCKRPQLLAFIDRRLSPALRRKIDPEDMFQELSADALRALPGTEFGVRDPFSWLCQIAERRIIDAHRRFFEAQKRSAYREISVDSGGDDSQHVGLVNLLVASMTTASEAFSRGEKEIRLAAAMESLPPEHRQALEMRYVQGLPSKDIAERLGKTDGAIRVMLTRALHRLQEMLGEEGEGARDKG